MNAFLKSLSSMIIALLDKLGPVTWDGGTYAWSDIAMSYFYLVCIEIICMKPPGIFRMFSFSFEEKILWKCKSNIRVICRRPHRRVQISFRMVRGKYLLVSAQKRFWDKNLNPFYYVSLCFKDLGFPLYFLYMHTHTHTNSYTKHTLNEHMQKSWKKKSLQSFLMEVSFIHSPTHIHTTCPTEMTRT